MKKLAVVTGGAGFIGSHLCERLVKDGYRVISLDNYFAGSSENHVADVEYRAGHTKNISSIIPERPDILFHLGEYSRVEQSVLEPDIVEDLNTVGTEGVLAFWRVQKCKLVYAGSSTKFGDEGRTRYSSPYAITKAANSERVKFIGDSESLPYAIAYFYNVYGPRERSGVYGTVIEHFKQMYVGGMPCAIVSPGTQKRNFTHVADIVDGLVLIGERGAGDEYGLGSLRAYSIFEVANLFGFGSDIVLFPERPGNRTASDLDPSKSESLGWSAQGDLAEYIHEFIQNNERGIFREKRVLVFSTTMPPVAGLAENGLIELAQALPDLQFDVVTTRFTNEMTLGKFPQNMSIYRLGIGYRIDKFLLPALGFIYASVYLRKRKYIFAWSLMASYATLAGILLKMYTQIPLLVTLADQNMDDVSPVARAVLRGVITSADQVYGTHSSQEVSATKVFNGALPRNSIGAGNSFANALRYAYAEIIRRSL